MSGAAVMYVEISLHNATGAESCSQDIHLIGRVVELADAVDVFEQTVELCDVM